MNSRFENDVERLYIFCVNLLGLVLADYYEGQGVIVSLMDNDKTKQGQKICGFSCINPNDGDRSIRCVITATKSGDVIKEQLISLGYKDIGFPDDAWKDRYYHGYAKELNDEKYLKFDWYLRFGTELNLDNPITFNEKLQWLKLHDRKEEYFKLADKYEAKMVVSGTIGEKYVVPVIQVCDSFDEICIEKLPDKFVIKSTHDSGGVKICRDKSKFDFSLLKIDFDQRLKENYFYCEREWAYKGIKPRIIIEELLESDGSADVWDYKFFCFNGEVKLIQVDFDRSTDHHRNLYTEQWEYMDASIKYPNNPNIIIPKPSKFDEMLWCVKKLAKGIPHVRIDLYYVNERIYFGEFTFYHGGGYELFLPEELGIKLGSFISEV